LDLEKSNNSQMSIIGRFVVTNNNNDLNEGENKEHFD
jgi:hypothetical protein